MARVSKLQRLPIQNTFLTRPIAITTNTSPPEGKRRLSSLFSHFEALLQNSCQNARHLLQIQALLVTSSLFRNPYLARTILSRASHLCDVAYTRVIFRSINSLDTFCVNIVIQAYSNSHAPREAIVFYFRSLMRGFFPQQLHLRATRCFVCQNGLHWFWEGVSCSGHEEWG